MAIGKNDPTNPWAWGDNPTPGLSHTQPSNESVEDKNKSNDIAKAGITAAMSVFSNPPKNVRIIGSQGSSGYLGSSQESMTPMLLISKPNEVDPITDTNTRKFGVPVNRPSTSDDITVDGITLNANCEFSNAASTNYCEFSRIKLNSVLGDYNELISILNGGVYI